MRTAKKPPRHRYAKPAKAKAPSSATPKCPDGLTPAVRAIIVTGAKAGVPWAVVADRAGCSQFHIRKWRSMGQAISEHFAEHNTLPDGADVELLRFYDELEAAHSTAVETFTKTIAKAAKKNWVAAAWWLERRSPEYFRLKKAPDEKPKSEGEITARVIILPDNGRRTK